MAISFVSSPACVHVCKCMYVCIYALYAITTFTIPTDLTGLSLQGASSGQMVKDEYTIRMDCEVTGSGGGGSDSGGGAGPSGLSVIPHQPQPQPTPGPQQAGGALTVSRGPWGGGRWLTFKDWYCPEIVSGVLNP